MQTLAEFIANVISLIFNLFTDFDISGIQQAVQVITPYIKGALYILPGETIKNIFAVVVMLWSFRIIIKTLKTIWNIIPIL